MLNQNVILKYMSMKIRIYYQFIEFIQFDKLNNFLKNIWYILKYLISNRVARYRPVIIINGVPFT